MQPADSRFDSELRDIVRAGDAGDCVDDVVPDRVATPTCEEQVLTLIRAAIDERRTMICTGGRTSLCVGNPPRSFDVALDTRNLDNIVEHRPEDMTITVQAGITIQSLAAELVSSGQRIAWDPHQPEHATVGGVLASNSTGGLAYGFGQPRDLVLGMTVIDGHGRVLRLGGRVVKNVAGYDLVRLFTGSHGSLGVIAEATLRCHPQPAVARTMRVHCDNSEHLERARKELFASHLPLAALDFEMATSTTSHAWTLYLRVEGSSREVEAQRDRIRDLCKGTIDDDDGLWRSPVHAEGDFVMRVGVAPASTVAFARRLAATGSEPLLVGGRLGDGTLRVSAQRAQLNDEASFLDRVQSAARAFGGMTVIESASPAVKRGRSVWDEGDTPIALMHAIKSRFDPHGLFAPGRFVGGL